MQDNKLQTGGARSYDMKPFRIEKTPFPASIRGTVRALCQDQGETCLIILDSTATAEAQAKSLLHELAHIALNHFDCERPLKEIEAEANQFAQQITFDELAELMTWEEGSQTQ